MKAQDAAIKILKEAGKPLHAKEIAKRIMEPVCGQVMVKHWRRPSAPAFTRILKKLGEQSTFVKVAPQTFFLRDSLIINVFDAKEPDPWNVNPSDNKRTCSFLDAANKVKIPIYCISI